MIDPKFLTFLSLCETRNYTKTAELLYVTQPSVTNHIKTLEKLYDIKLFTSNTKNFKLTPEGELLYKYVLQLKAMDAQFERMLSATGNQKEYLTFSVTKNINNGFLKYLLSRWTKENPNLNYSLLIKEYEDILEDLNQGLIDFAIIDNRFTKKNFHSVQLYNTNMVLAVNKKHPLAKMKKVSFDILAKENIILDAKGTGKRDFLESE
jgi:DNA-binding transcriptional LysR family regulator